MFVLDLREWYQILIDVSHLILKWITLGSEQCCFSSLSVTENVCSAGLLFWAHYFTSIYARKIPSEVTVADVVNVGKFYIHVSYHFLKWPTFDPEAYFSVIISFFPFFPFSTSAGSYFMPVILVSKDWIRFLASSFQRWVLFCCAVTRLVISALELRIHSSSSRTCALSPCSFRLYSCSICDTCGGGGGGGKQTCLW